jgi:putative endonuclease
MISAERPPPRPAGASARKAGTSWTVYMLRCADGSLYTGITNDVARRVGEHNSNGLLAARYTRARRPVVLVYRETVATRSAACKREYRIKQMTRSEKQELLRAVPARRVAATRG